MNKEAIYKILKFFIEKNHLKAKNHHDLDVHRKIITTSEDNDVIFTEHDLHILEELGYLKKILHNQYITTSKGESFYYNYDNSISAKLDNYLGKYPNISNLFYFFLGVIFGLIPYIIFN